MYEPTTGAVAPPQSAVAPRVLLLGTNPDFECILERSANDDDDRYDLMAEQDLELTLAEKGIAS